MAAAQGFGDGEGIPLDWAIDNLRRIAAAVELPVTVDLEGAYGREPAAVARCAAMAAEAGAVGCNFEDRMVGGRGLYEAAEQSARIAAIREAAGPHFFVNARVDLFLQTKLEAHDEKLLGEALERGRAYGGAGASGLFLPGLTDERLIASACERSPLPVNIMVWAGTPPLKRLAELGVARISHAGTPWRVAMKVLAEAARAAHDMRG